MPYNIFEMPALVFVVDPDRLQLQYTSTTLLDCENVDTEAAAVPYGDFLNQCISFDISQWERAFEELRRTLPKAEDISDLRGGINMLRRRVNSEFERHLDLSLEFRLPRILTQAAEKRVELFNFEIDLLTKPTGQALLSLLTAAELAPFYDADPHDLALAKEDLSDEHFMPPVFAAGSRVIGFVLTDILETFIKTFIWNMRSNNLYLHRCSICGTWFVRLNKHKAAFCGGSYCLNHPEETPTKRLATKLKTFPYWGAHRTEYNFWMQRKLRGQLTPSQFKAWQTEAKHQRGMVDADKLSANEYTDWLCDCRKMADEICPDTQDEFWKEKL